MVMADPSDLGHGKNNADNSTSTKKNPTYNLLILVV